VIFAQKHEILTKIEKKFSFCLESCWDVTKICRSIENTCDRSICRSIEKYWDRSIFRSIDSFGFENRSIDCTSAENWILQKQNQSSVQTQKQFKAEPKPLMHRIYNINRIKLDKILNTSQTTVCNPRQRRQKLVAITTDD
jgi:hypothetical protein